MQTWTFPPAPRATLLRPLPLWASSFVAGMFFAGRVEVETTAWSLSLALSLGLWWWLLSRRLPGRSLGVLWLAFQVGCLTASAERQQRLKRSRLVSQGLQGQKRWVEGIIHPPIRHGPHGPQAVLQIVRVASCARGPWRRLPGLIRLRIVGPFTLQAGARVRMALRLRPPRWYGMPGLYNARDHLLRQGIRLQASVRAQRVLRVGMPPARSSRSWIARWRRQLARWIRTHIPHPDARALLCALLLGLRDELTPALRDAFARTGTSHMLAISGLHIAIVASASFFLLRACFSRSSWLLLHLSPRKLAASCSFVPVLVYTLISGAAISTCRALAMVCVCLLAILLERSAHLFTSLALAAIAILVSQPTALFTLSFQLSFVSVMALAFGASALQAQTTDRIQQKNLLARLLRWALALCLSSCVAMCGTLPLTSQFFPHLALAGPLINLFAIPIGGYLVVGLGLLAIALKSLWPALALILLKGSALCAQALCLALRWFASRPWSAIQIPPLRIHESIGVFCALSAAALWRHRPKAARFTLTLAICVPLCGTLIPIVKPDTPRLTLRFLDIGQGDATLIRFPNGQHMLVDAGGEPFLPFDVGAHVLLPYFRWLRLPKLNFAVLSHPHPDHFGGFPSLLPHYPPKEFWHNAEVSRHPGYRALQRTLKRHRIPTRTFRHTRRLSIAGVRIDILHPFPGPYEGTTHYWALHANDNSLVMRLTFGKIRILLTGDIETRAEAILMQRHKDLRVDLLKVPHHGSRTSSTAAFLDRTKPRHAVFSLGRSNTFGFPHPEVLARYKSRKIRVWRTDKHGLIQASTDGSSLQFSTFLAP